MFRQDPDGIGTSTPENRLVEHDGALRLRGAIIVVARQALSTVSECVARDDRTSIASLVRYPSLLAYLLSNK
jgi:hypothetical protein